jgi:hypothetical protein
MLIYRQIVLGSDVYNVLQPSEPPLGGPVYPEHEQDVVRRV